MRGRGGLRGVSNQLKMNQNMKKKGEEMELKQIHDMTNQLAMFSNNLEEFGSKYRNEIRLNPEFREQFYMMCTDIGVDPLASKSLWNKTLNLSEFYYELAIQIITVSIALREKLGALLELNELKQILANHRKKDDISIMDIEKAISSVSELKCGFQIVKLSNSKRAVMTIPMQMSNETNIILELANQYNGCISYKHYKDKGDYEFFENVMNSFITKGIVWIDDLRNEIVSNSNSRDSQDCIVYWFPGLMNK